MLPILPNPWESAGLPDEEVRAEQPRTAPFLAPEGFRPGDLASPVLYLGQRARTADSAALGKAEKMEDAGRNRDAILRSTGWGRDPEDIWQWELSDHTARILNRRGATLEEILHHPELLKAHPDLRNIVIQFAPLRDGVRAEYHQPSGGSGERIVISESLADEMLLHTLGHELQHAIQYRERFPPGSAPLWMQQQIQSRGAGVGPERIRDPFTAYLNSRGETQARDVEFRWNWTPEQRMNQPPWATERPPRDRQIIVHWDGDRWALPPDIPLPRARPRDASDIPIPRAQPPICLR